MFTNPIKYMTIMTTEPTMDNVRAAHRALREACANAVRYLARLSEPEHPPETADPNLPTEEIS